MPATLRDPKTEIVHGDKPAVNGDKPAVNGDKLDAKGDKLPATSADRQALIEGLNSDLAGEYQAILMYIHYSAKLTGPFRRELRALFQAEVPDEQGHAQFLADKIAALGGDPTTEPKPVPHADQPHEMLEHGPQGRKTGHRRLHVHASARPNLLAKSASK